MATSARLAPDSERDCNADVHARRAWWRAARPALGSPGGRSARLGRLSPKRRQLEVSPSTSGAARQGASVWLIGTQGDMRRPQSRSIHKSGSGTAPACRLREDTGMFGCRSRPPCSAPLGEPGSGPPDPGSTGRTERPSPLRAFRRSLPAGAASCLDGTRSSCLIVRIRWRAPLLELPRLKCLRSSAPG